MANPQLLDYINQQVSSGVDIQSVKSSLVTSGWSSVDIEAAMASFNGPTPVARATTVASKRPFMWLIITLVLLMLIAGAYIIVHYASKSANVASPSVTPVAQAAKLSWSAKMIGTGITEDDKAQIVKANIEVATILNVGDVAGFRKYAVALLSPQQMKQIQNVSDAQLADLMKASGKLIAGSLTSQVLTSSKATWTIKDADHVEIKIQDNANSVTTVQAVRINGIWY